MAGGHAMGSSRVTFLCRRKSPKPKGSAGQGGGPPQACCWLAPLEQCSSEHSSQLQLRQGVAEAAPIDGAHARARVCRRVCLGTDRRCWISGAAPPSTCRLPVILCLPRAPSECYILHTTCILTQSASRLSPVCSPLHRRRLPAARGRLASPRCARRLTQPPGNDTQGRLRSCVAAIPWQSPTRQ